MVIPIEFHGRKYKRATETDLPFITDGYLPLIGEYVDQFEFMPAG